MSNYPLNTVGGHLNVCSWWNVMLTSSKIITWRRLLWIITSAGNVKSAAKRLHAVAERRVCMVTSRRVYSHQSRGRIEIKPRDETWSFPSSWCVSISPVEHILTLPLADVLWSTAWFTIRAFRHDLSPPALHLCSAAQNTKGPAVSPTSNNEILPLYSSALANYTVLLLVRSQKIPQATLQLC